MTLPEELQAAADKGKASPDDLKRWARTVETLMRAERYLLAFKNDLISELRKACEGVLSGRDIETLRPAIEKARAQTWLNLGTWEATAEFHRKYGDVQVTEEMRQSQLFLDMKF